MRLLSSLLMVLALSIPLHAVEMGDDGLHKTEWMHNDTFKDMAEDFAEARAQGKRFMVIWEQRGCIYCTKMHNEVFPVPEIDAMLTEDYFVVQLNLFGDVEVTDFDGETLSERDMAMKWGIMFTPTMMFFPAEIEAGLTAPRNAVVTMPGAFGKSTTLNLLTWVRDEGYLSGENFQAYHARVVNARKNQ